MAINDRKKNAARPVAVYFKTISIERVVTAVNFAHKTGELKILEKSEAIKPPKLRVVKF